MTPLVPEAADRLPDPRAEIRDFLSSSRARLTPDMVGMPTSARRRVPGLRREEVALLAGVSVDYYTRLERGNLAGASPEVLDALADALRLDDNERAHLADLAAALRPAGHRRHRSASTPMRRTVRPGIQWMLDATSQPALVTDPLTNHVACNCLARALYAPLYRDPLPVVTGDRHTAGPQTERSSTDQAQADRGRISQQAGTGGQPNMAWFIFLDPRAHEFFPAWDQVAADTVAMLRLASGRRRGDAAMAALVGELSTTSRDFARM